jgi:DNA polymerase-1
LKISRTEAKEYINLYFKQYQGVKKYMDDTIDFCLENGYVETLKGRRRYVPEIHSPNRQMIEGAKKDSD